MSLLLDAINKSNYDQVEILLKRNARLHVTCDLTTPYQLALTLGEAGQWLLEDDDGDDDEGPHLSLSARLRQLERIRIDHLVTRINNYHQQCRQACIALYAVLRNHLCNNKDVTVYIVRIVWETRSDELWHRLNTFFFK